MMSTFSRLRCYSPLFRSVFHYWELYKQFEYRVAMSRFKTSSTCNETRRANPIFRVELSTRSGYLSPLYFNTVMRLARLYVTPDYLHRYRKPTAWNIASRDLRVHRQIRRRLFTPSGLCSRAESIMRADLPAKSMPPGLSGYPSYTQLLFLSVKPPRIAWD